MDSRLEDGSPAMDGAARAGDDDARALALGERLKAWFAALSRQPTPKRLLDHVEELERDQASPPPERPTP